MICFNLPRFNSESAIHPGFRVKTATLSCVCGARISVWAAPDEGESQHQRLHAWSETAQKLRIPRTISALILRGVGEERRGSRDTGPVGISRGHEKPGRRAAGTPKQSKIVVGFIRTLTQSCKPILNTTTPVDAPEPPSVVGGHMQAYVEHRKTRPRDTKSVCVGTRYAQFLSRGLEVINHSISSAGGNREVRVPTRPD